MFTTMTQSNQSATWYRLLGVSSTCTDAELRAAYRQAVKSNHPDLNPDHTDEAKRITQEIIDAHDRIKASRAVKEPSTDDGNSFVAYASRAFRISITFVFTRHDNTDLEDVRQRKEDFRSAWHLFDQNRGDPLAALGLAHAAIRARRQDVVKEILRDTALIDAAPMLLEMFPMEHARESLLLWVEFLEADGRIALAVQMLEDAYAMDPDHEPLKLRLRSLHYAWAQYSDPTTGNPATPEIRIAHLMRIIELGYRDGYLYKLLAEAHHNMGNDDAARALLREAFSRDPELSGAVRISRALGFLPESAPARKPVESRATKQRVTDVSQFPSLSQVRKWQMEGSCTELVRYADLSSFSPQVIGKLRVTHEVILKALGKCDSDAAISAFTAILQHNPDPTVGRLALLGLSKIGNKSTLSMLKSQGKSWIRLKQLLPMVEAYLYMRLENENQIATKRSHHELFQLAETAYARHNIGKARYLSEQAILVADCNSPSLDDAHILAARTCHEMSDYEACAEWILPIVSATDPQRRKKAPERATAWMYSAVAVEPYYPNHDPILQAGISAHLDAAMEATRPGDMFGSLGYAARWLALLGATEQCEYIRALVTTEAPGSGYMDKQSFAQYIRPSELSAWMTNELVSIDKRLRREVGPKLVELVNGTYGVDHPG